MLWNFGNTFAEAISQIDAGTFGNAGLVQDVTNGGISLLETPHITPEAWTAVEAAKAGIADGSITVPTTTTQAEVEALYGG